MNYRKIDVRRFSCVMIYAFNVSHLTLNLPIQLTTRVTVARRMNFMTYIYNEVKKKYKLIDMAKERER